MGVVRDELYECFRSLLLEESFLPWPYGNRERLMRIVKEHVKGENQYVLEINRALTVALNQGAVIGQPR